MCARACSIVSCGTSSSSPLPALSTNRLREGRRWCEQRTGTTLAPSQKEALKTILTSRAAIISGGPGVGKTTLVDSILMILRAKGAKCLLCAPTYDLLMRANDPIFRLLFLAKAIADMGVGQDIGGTGRIVFKLLA